MRCNPCHASPVIKLWQNRLLMNLSAALFATIALWAPASAHSQDFVTGRVTDKEGSSVPGATVRALSGTLDTSATTDVEGQYRVAVEVDEDGLIDARLTVETRDGRIAFQSLMRAHPGPIAELVLQPGRELIVEVHNAIGQTVEGAEVACLVNGRTMNAGLTNSHGRWKCRVPASAVWWAVFARKPGLGFDYVAGTPAGGVRKPHPLPDRLTLNLDGAHTLRVKAVDQAGQPVADVKVGPMALHKAGNDAPIYLRDTMHQWPVTDAQGLIVLDWLPRRYERDVDLVVQSDDYYVVDGLRRFGVRDLPSELTLQMLPLEELSGRVTYPDGKPAADMVVKVRGRGDGGRQFIGRTTTNSLGLYTLQVHSGQSYIVAANGQRWAAPYRTGIVVNAGKPVNDVDLVLGPATRLHGRITAGPDKQPMKYGGGVSVDTSGGALPDDPQAARASLSQALAMSYTVGTDPDGYYELYLAPGEYLLRGPRHTEPAKIVIPAAKPPLEIVHHFHLPRLETGPFKARVVDHDGQPVAGAVVSGWYTSSKAGRMIYRMKSDARGELQVLRALYPLVLHARTADGQRAGTARIDAESPQGQVVVGPVATATGRLLDRSGDALPNTKLRYGIRVNYASTAPVQYIERFGGVVTTDGNGRFTLPGLVPGETYHLSLQSNQSNPPALQAVTPKSAEAVDLGDLKADIEPSKP